MTFSRIYRASFYAMLVFATLVLSIDATDDNPLAMLYPPGVALAGLVAFFTVDRNPKLAPSRSVASFLALASAGLSVAEFQYNPNLILLATAHWLVYLQVIKMFLPKQVEDDWFLFLLGLVQVLVGGVISQSANVGIALFIWALLALWVLSLFALHREALRLGTVPRPAEEVAPEAPSEIYRGLLDAPFFLASIRVAATTLALGGIIFLAMPRRASMGMASRGAGLPGQHLSGFDDEVQLGQMGEILENDTIVMSIELFRGNGSRIAPDADDEYRWRGATMSQYETGRWRRQSLRQGGNMESPGREPDPRSIRQTIKMEPTDSSILFGLRPVLDTNSPLQRSLPTVSSVDGSLQRSSNRAVPVDYEIVSGPDPDAPQPGENYPGRAYLRELLSMPESLRERFRALALEQVGHIPAENVRARAEGLEHFLRDTGRYTYTLKMDRVDPDDDPVADFLLNRKAGHCEYFASALTLLLRSIDIPARMVNGFKGGDHNAIAGMITVRQKHAHSWVEALMGPSEEFQYEPLWITLDASPADQRNETVARVGGVSGYFRQVTDLIRYLWVFYVIGFNSERQDRLLYGPIGRLVEDAKNGFRIMADALRSLLHFPSVGSFFSLRGFLVSFFALLLLVGLARLAGWAAGRIFRWLRGPKAEAASLGAGIAFHGRLLRLLAEVGLERPAAETPREFARRAAIFLSGNGSGADAVADVPPLVVDAFYRVRFGEHVLPPDQLAHLDARLDALEAHLHPEAS